MKIKLLSICIVMIVLVPFVPIFAAEEEATMVTGSSDNWGESKSVINLQKRNIEMQNKIDARKVERAKQINDKKTKVDKKTGERICKKVDNIISKIEKRMSDRMVNANNRLENRLTKLNTNRENRNNSLVNRREARDKAREKMYIKLEDRAKSDEENRAINNFKNIIEEAVTVRRDAIDGANQTMRDNIDESIENKKLSLEELVEDFKKVEQGAINKVERACGDDMTSDELKNILMILKKDLKSARDDYRIKANEIKKIEDTVNELKEVKKTSIQSAIDLFEETIKNAHKILVVNLKIKNNSE